MAESKTPDRTNTGKRGGPKTSLSRLELYLMGKGPTATVQRKMLKDSTKGGPAKARS